MLFVLESWACCDHTEGMADFAPIRSFESVTSPGPLPAKHTREEMMVIFRAAREEVKAHNPTGRDLLAEFLNERREAATRGE